MKKVSKVALLSLNYLPNVGGLVRYLESLSEDLICEGIQVDIYCSDAQNKDLKENETINKVNVFRERIYENNALLKPFTPFVASYRFFNFIKKHDFSDYDIIICRHTYPAFALSMLSELHNKSIFLIPLASPKLQAINIKKQNLIKKIYNILLIPQLFLIERFCMKKLKNIATLSKSKKIELEKYYNVNQKLNVVYPGVNFNKFSPLNYGQVMLLKKSLIGTYDNEFVFSTVCRLVEEKNIKILLDSFSDILKVNAKCLLLVAGDGPLENALKRHTQILGIEKAVKFLGYCEKPEEVYAVSDMFVLPSFYEGFGHVFVEANACGVPVIGFKNNPPKVITATDEIITHGLNGYIAEECTVEGLKNVMLNGMKDVTYKGKTVTQRLCREYAMSNFTWKVHFKKLLSLIND